MNPKEHLLKQKSFKKISKNGLLENDKKLLVQKLGFTNLSSFNLIKRKIISNNNNKNVKYKPSISNLKIDTEQITKIPSLMNFNHKPNKDMATSTFKKSSNISLLSSNVNINTFSEFKKSTETLKKSLRQNILYRNNKLGTEVMPIKTIININTVSNSTLKKRKNKNSNSNCNTTTQNTLKTNKYSNSNFDLFSAFSQLEPIHTIKKKQKIKIKINASTPNLLSKVKKPIIKDKEKTYKINGRDFSNNNLYNDNNYKYKKKIKITNNSKSKTKKKLINPLNLSSKEYLRIDNNINFNTKGNNKYKKTISKNNRKLSTITQSDIVNIDKNNEIINTNNSINKSEETKKESRVDLHKIFNDKFLNNLKYRNNIYDIISINMKNNFNNQININANNNKNKINEQNTINEEEDDENYNLIKNNNKKENSKIKLKSNNIVINNSNNKYINIITNNNLDKENNDTNKNLMNFSDIINYYVSEEEHNKDYSFNINKNINLKIMTKEEEEFQSSQDKNNEQTQTTNDKNIISKFIKTPIYNISPRFFSVDKISVSKYSLKNKSFKFINDIEINNKNIPQINIKKILSLNDKSIFNILAYSYDNYNSIISSSIILKNKINKCLKNIFQQVIDDFQNKYKNILKVLNFSFEKKNMICKHKINTLFNLIITAQIITKLTNKSYEIGCNYISYGKSYDNIWKFDVRNKKDIKLWFCTESGLKNSTNKNITYTSQISSFSYQDELILELNIFSKGNNVEPNSIEWSEPNISNEIMDIYENNSFISSIKFDPLRACEVELQVLFWKNIINKDIVNIIDDFKNIFQNNFKIQEIYYDISKFYFFKFKMIANKVGVLKHNRYLSFDINIIEYECNIQNEIQCIYLVNNYKNKKKIEIRLNSLVIFYIIDMKR